MALPILTTNDLCTICGKIPTMALNRPHSQHKTKRVVRPNLGAWEGLQICAKCRKGLAKPDRVRKVNEPVVAETKATATA